jgi:hypothetical protein
MLTISRVVIHINLRRSQPRLEVVVKGIGHDHVIEINLNKLQSRPKQKKAVISIGSTCVKNSVFECVMLLLIKIKNEFYEHHANRFLNIDSLPIQAKTNSIRLVSKR